MARRPAPGTLAVVTAYQRPGLTPRGLAVVHAIRLAEAVHQLDAADREYLAPIVAALLVDLRTNIPALAR